ncbi:MAG: rhodanese-like domain-containing protein [Rubrivivax sp.]
MPPNRPSRRRLVLATGLGVLGSATAWAQGDSPSAGAPPAAAPAPGAVTLDAARQAHESGQAVLIDIREPIEHARGVAAGAVLLPMSQLRQRVGEIPTDPSRPVLLISNTHTRAAAPLRALRQHGYGHVSYVDGGMAEWVRRGWPVVLPGR